MVLLYGLVCILGLLFGSFINVCIFRIPEGKSIIIPLSACTKCGNGLKPLDLIPVFSFIFLKGRCRYCNAQISARYPLVELLTAAVFLILYAKFEFTIAFFAFAFLMVILITVAFIDIDHKIIPNGLVITGLAGGIALFAYNIYYPVTNVFGDEKWFTPILGMLSGSGILFLVAVIGLIIYRTDNAMGMGDVKLSAPIGLFLGWKLCLIALFLSIMIAGIISLLLMIMRVKKRRDTIPFGPFIVLGTFITIIWGWGILNWYANYL